MINFQCFALKTSILLSLMYLALTMYSTILEDGAKRHSPPMKMLFQMSVYIHMHANIFLVIFQVEICYPTE